MDNKSLFKVKDYETFKSILDTKVDINILDKNGRSPIFYVKNIKILDLLINAKVSIDIKDNQGKTLLFYKRNPEIIKMILDNVNDPEEFIKEKDLTGKNVLDLFKDEEFIDIILSYIMK